MAGLSAGIFFCFLVITPPCQNQKATPKPTARKPVWWFKLQELPLTDWELLLAHTRPSMISQCVSQMCPTSSMGEARVLPQSLRQAAVNERDFSQRTLVMDNWEYLFVLSPKKHINKRTIQAQFGKIKEKVRDGEGLESIAQSPLVQGRPFPSQLRWTEQGQTGHPVWIPKYLNLYHF